MPDLPCALPCHQHRQRARAMWSDPRRGWVIAMVGLVITKQVAGL